MTKNKEKNLSSSTSPIDSESANDADKSGRREFLRGLAYTAPILAPLLLDEAQAAGTTVCTPNQCNPSIPCGPAQCGPNTPCAPLSTCAPLSCGPYSCGPTP